METEEIARQVRVEKRLLHAFALARDYRACLAAGEREAAARVRRSIEALAVTADFEARAALVREMMPPAD